VAVNCEYGKGSGHGQAVGEDDRNLNPRLPKYEIGSLFTVSRTGDSAVWSDVSMNDAVEALKLLAPLTVSCT
jgi:hypothetical protein